MKTRRTPTLNLSALALSMLLPVSLMASALFSIGCATSRKASEGITANPLYGKLPPSRGPMVILMPQWHLAAGENTKPASPGSSTSSAPSAVQEGAEGASASEFGGAAGSAATKSSSSPSPAALPQAENQLAIYKQISEWIDSDRIKSVVVEGCEGEIDDGFVDKFNGWSLDDLQKASSSDLDAAMTQIGLKIKAKYGKKVRVFCGDKLDLIKKHQLVLSDLRGLFGFKTRIVQYKDDNEKLNGYIEAVRPLLDVPTNKTRAEVVQTLDRELILKVDQFEKLVVDRNNSFVQTIKSSPQPEAVVIGALHVQDLQQRLIKKHEAVVTYEPVGLSGDEAELVPRIKALITAPK